MSNTDETKSLHDPQDPYEMCRGTFAWPINDIRLCVDNEIRGAPSITQARSRTAQMARTKGTTISDITPKQRAFALALVANGGNKTQAAITAGYSKNTAAVIGSVVSRNPKVLSLLREMTEQMLADLAPAAVAKLGKLVRHKSGYVSLEAVKDVLNRNSIGTLKEQPKTAPLIVNISFGDAPEQMKQAQVPVVLDQVSSAIKEAGGVQKLPADV